MPAFPPPAWGKPFEGLRCGVSVNPKRLVLGDPISVRIEFASQASEPFLLGFNAPIVLKQLRFENHLGQSLQVNTDVLTRRPAPAEKEIKAPPRGSGMLPRVFDPGTGWTTTIEGTLAAPPGMKEIAPGRFQASLIFELNDTMLSEAWMEQKVAPAWVGQVTSGRFTFNVEAN